MMKTANRFKKPLVSVIMPVYNSSKYLRDAIDSVLNQSYTKIELIAVDDGSTDSSYKILKDYANKYPKTVKVYKNKSNLGVSKTSNYAISKSRGEYIARMDSDDVMPIDRLEKQVNYLNKHSNVVVVGGQVVTMTEDGIKIADKAFPTKYQDIYDGMYTVMTIQQGAMMVNKTKLPNGFVWYKDDHFTAEEVDLFFRLFEYGKFANLKSVVLYYRQYSTSTSLKNPKQTFYNTINTRRKAVKSYGYVPTKSAKLINVLQYIVVSLMPSFLVYPVFTLYRGMSSVGSVFARLLSNTSPQFVYTR